MQIVYVQVDDKKSHSKWNKPEEIKQGWPRPSYFINRQKPGTDLCSEYVAALSAAHLCFKRAKQQELFTEEGAGEFVAKLKSVSLKLWEFSEMAKIKNQGALEGVKYSDSVPEAGEMYPSSHYQDERCWALLWLYRATGDKKYYDSARQILIFRKFNFMQQSKHMFRNGSSSQFSIRLKFFYRIWEVSIEIQLVFSNIQYMSVTYNLPTRFSNYRYALHRWYI